MNRISATLAIVIVSASLLVGCDSGGTAGPTPPTSSPAEVEPANEADEAGNVGGLAPYVSPKGVGFGVDLGNGLVLTPGGGLGVGL